MPFLGLRVRFPPRAPFPANSSGGFCPQNPPLFFPTLAPSLNRGLQQDRRRPPCKRASRAQMLSLNQPSHSITCSSLTRIAQPSETPKLCKGCPRSRPKGVRPASGGESGAHWQCWVWRTPDIRNISSCGIIPCSGAGNRPSGNAHRYLTSHIQRRRTGPKATAVCHYFVWQAAIPSSIESDRRPPREESTYSGPPHSPQALCTPTSQARSVYSGVDSAFALPEYCVLVTEGPLR